MIRNAHGYYGFCNPFDLKIKEGVNNKNVRRRKVELQKPVNFNNLLKFDYNDFIM